MNVTATLPGERAMARDRWRRAATGLMGLALAASPTYVVRAQVGPLPVTALEIVLVVAIAVGLYAFWDELPWRSPYVLPAALLLAAATISTVAAPSHRAAAGLWKAYFVEPMLAGLVVAAIARERARARLLLAGLGLAGTIAAVANIAAVTWALAHRTFSVVTPPVTIYNSANDVPLYLEPLLAFALAVAFFDHDRRDRALAAAFAVVAGAAVLLSYSRAGWITLAALLLFIALFGRRRWLAVAATLLAGGGLFIASDSVRRRVLVEFDFASPQNTVGLRLSLWKSTLDMLSHRPLLGAGLSGFKAAIVPYRGGYHEDLMYPHDLLLNFWSETGLAGLVASIWLGVQAVRQGLVGLALDRWPRIMSIGLLGMLLTVLLHGLVDAPYFKNDLALAFWALVAVQLGSLPRHRPALTGP